MKPRHLVLLTILILVFIVACAEKYQAPTVTSPQQQAPTNAEIPKPKEEVQKIMPLRDEIEPEIRDLLSKHKTRIKSIYYKYRGPKTGSSFYEFYIKDAKIKYKPSQETKFLDRPESVDSIFIDSKTKTAKSYCEAAYCTYKGKKQDLIYDDAYIMTVFDWVDVIQATKVGEEVIDSRSTWKLETEKGTIWVDLFYGIPLKAESNGNVYRFEQIAVNSVQDSDVVPSS